MNKFKIGDYVQVVGSRSWYEVVSITPELQWENGPAAGSNGIFGGVEPIYKYNITNRNGIIRVIPECLLKKAEFNLN